MESEHKRSCLELDAHQTRRFYLAGTVAFPAPFPATGPISIEGGSFQLPDDDSNGRIEEKKSKRDGGAQPEGEPFVVVQEGSGLANATIRVVRESDVRAIFFPGVWVDADKGRIFIFAQEEYVDNLERGEWFLGPQINADEISKRLKLHERGIDITCRYSGVRGIVFVPEHRRVVTIHETAQLAVDAVLKIRGNCSTWGPCMPRISTY
jgi:hypothetical protein